MINASLFVRTSVCTARVLLLTRVNARQDTEGPPALSVSIFVLARIKINLVSFSQIYLLRILLTNIKIKLFYISIFEKKILSLSISIYIYLFINWKKKGEIFFKTLDMLSTYFGDLEIFCQQTI